MSLRGEMGPPPDKDIVMGPPPNPYPLANGGSKTKDSQHELAEKYSRLKKRYFELEQKFKTAQEDLQKSGERNVKIREERNVLLDRIIELEQQQHLSPTPSPQSVDGTVPQLPNSGAFPRALVSLKSQAAFAANLRQAMNELENEDHEIDPMLTSRHVGPTARKRQAEEDKERQEEEMRATKRVARRPKAASRTVSGKDIPSPLSFNPPPHPAGASGPQDKLQAPQSSSPPLVVTNGGTRLRIKPPARSPHEQPQHAGPGVPGPPLLSPHGSVAGVPISPRSQSPISPLSPPDEPVAHSPTSARNAPNAVSLGGQGSRPSDIQRQTKPKRLKAHTVTSKSYSIPMVPRDKHTGKPMLPLNVGIMTVVNLGEVCMREHFHTERYIFPVGYEVTRRYFSTIDPNAEVVYHCTILDGGDGPKFQIIAADMPDKPIIAGTATGAWSGIVRAANLVRTRQHSNSVSGPDYFGLGQNTIKHLIQELPGADKLRDYVWQKFVEGGPLGGRHAAVIPALPEEFESSMPVGGYYPSERERERERQRERDRETQRQLAEHAEQDRLTRIHHQPPPPQPTGPMPPPAHPEEARRPRRSSRNMGHDERAQQEEYDRHAASASARSSPQMHREQRGSHNPSPRAAFAPGPEPQPSPPSVPSVPPTLASIMHAYPPPPPPPSGSPPGSDYNNNHRDNRRMSDSPYSGYRSSDERH